MCFMAKGIGFDTDLKFAKQEHIFTFFEPLTGFSMNRIIILQSIGLFKHI